MDNLVSLLAENSKGVFCIFAESKALHLGFGLCCQTITEINEWSLMLPQRGFLVQEKGSWINKVQFLQWKTFPHLFVVVGAGSKADTRGVQGPHHLIPRGI